MTPTHSSESLPSGPTPQRGATESQRSAQDTAPGPDSLIGMFQLPGLQSYVFTGLAALAMVFAVMFLRGSDLGGLILLLVGAAGIVFRRTAMPALFLLILTYFLIFPDGLPWIGQDWPERPQSLQLDHLLLVGSVIVYLSCHYRVYGLTKQALPYESRYPRRGEAPIRRDAALIRAEEIPILLGVTVGVILAGQGVWWVISHIEPDPLANIPFRVVNRAPNAPWDAEFPPPGITRGIILAGILAVGALLARGVFGYWWLRQLTPAEAGMVLQDTNWDETRREPSRLEVWRAWARKRVADRRAGAAGKHRDKGAKE